MRTKFEVRRIQFPESHAGERPLEPIRLVFEEEEDAFCDPYLVASRESDIPALQEYLHELRAD